jgi:hypothetical protein
MRTTVTIPDGLAQNAREQAERRGITFSEIVAEALRAHCSGRRAAGQRPFRLVTFSGRLVKTNSNLGPTSELLAREDHERFGRRR